MTTPFRADGKLRNAFTWARALDALRTAIETELNRLAIDVAAAERRDQRRLAADLRGLLERLIAIHAAAGDALRAVPPDPDLDPPDGGEC